MKGAKSFRIIGTGIGMPEAVLTNDEIRERLNPLIDCHWVTDRLGIAERRIAATGVYSSDLGAKSIKAALQRSAIDPRSIDLLIVATATPDRQAPSTACLIQEKAGLCNAVAFDVSAVCSGFLFALNTASMYMAAGRSKRAVVVGTDTFSRITDWGRNDCVFFGDGAGAVVLEASDAANMFFDADLMSNGAQSEVFTVKRGDATFTMDARGVYEAAAVAVPKCVNMVLQRNCLCADDVDVVIPHQPSINLLKRISSETGIPFQKFRTNMDRYANTCGATIPIILHETLESGAVKPSDLVMFAAAGAGFTAGAALYRWH